MLILQKPAHRDVLAILGTVHCPGLLVWSGGCWGALTSPLVEEEAPRDAKVVSVVSKAIW